MGVVPAVALAGIGAVASIGSGIMGARSASKQNARARRAQAEQEKYQKKIAKKTNKHNAKLDAADKANYFAMREFNHQGAMDQWRRNNDLQDFEYLNALKQYQKSLAIGNAQLGLNARAEAMGIQAEKDAIEEEFIAQQFEYEAGMSDLKQVYTEQNLNRQEAGITLQGIRSKKDFGNLSLQSTIDQLMTQGSLQKESAMVESLLAKGAIQATGQAGKSTAKAQQANSAALQRSLMSLNSEMSGKYKQAAIQLAELNVDSSLEEQKVGLNIERIGNAIENAEAEAEGNLEVMRANMQSSIRQTQRNIDQISLDREYANLNTKANVMIKPERMPYSPPPRKPPERIFIDRMKAMPGYTPPAQQQSVWAPLVQGIGGAAKAMAGGIDPKSGSFYD
jgi:hypothetical protein